MKQLGIFKINLIVFLSLLISLILALLLHNTVVFISGGEERVFYMLFIVIFFILPFSFLSLMIGVIIDHGRSKYLINKKVRDEQEDKELGIK